MKTFVRSGSTPIHLLVVLTFLIGLPLAVDWATGAGARSAAEAALAAGPATSDAVQRLVPTSAMSATIAGTVRDEISGLPVAGVQINTGTSDWRTSATTDVAGAYTLTVYGGTWWIEATKPGYLSTWRRNVAVIDGQRLDGLDLPLTPGTSFITGTLRYSTGGEVLNHWIHANEQTTGRESAFAPGASGVYSIAVTSGTWVVNSQRTGYTLRETPRVTIGDGQTAGPIDLVFLPNEATVSGRVRDQSGTPMAGSRVRAVDATTGWRLMDDVFADVSGTYTLPIAAGAWAINVSGMGGYRTPSNQTITVASGEVRSGVDFTLTASTATIAGTVRDAATGLPIAGAGLKAWVPEWGAEATTDASGAYTLTVSAGTWNVNVWKAGYSGGDRQVTVGDGEHLSGIDFSLRALNATIAGIVRDGATDLPIAGATVSTGGAGWGTNTTTDAAGAYTLTVYGGTWWVNPRKPGYLEASRTVSVGDGGRLDGLDFGLTPARSLITGTVRYSTGGALANWWVSGKNTTGDHNGVNADASGVYSLSVTAGTWTVGNPWTGHTLLETPRMTVGDGQTIGPVDLIFLPNDATVTGRVRDQAGGVVGGIQVMGVDVNTGWRVTDNAYLDATGAYTLSIAAGTRAIGVRAPGGYRNPPDQDVILVSGELRGGVDFTVTASTATIAGTVRDAANGLPLAGATLSGKGPGPDASATTDAAGAYTLTVAGGKWDLRAAKGGYVGSYGRTVSVGDGQHVDGADFSLAPATAWIVGTVRRGDGTALPGMNVWTWPQRWNAPGGTTGNADATGVYTLGVVAGSWYVIGGPAGQTLSRTPVVTVTDGQVATGTDLWLLTNSVTVTGRVRDQAGTGIADVRVRPFDPDTGHWLSDGTNTYPGGAYKLTLPVGTWQVGVEQQSDYRRPGNQTVTLGSGETRGGVDFVLTAANATISGVVRDGNGVPVAGARVDTWAPDWKTGATTDATGAYTLTVYAGAWDVSASKQGYAGSFSGSLTVGDGERRTGIDLTLRALNATIAGTVRDTATGLPVAGVKVRAYAPNGWSTETTTDAAGAYTLTVSAWTWNVNAFRSGYTSPSRSVTLGDGQRVDGIDFTVRALNATVAGTVRDETTGSPVGGVRLNVGASGFKTGATTDAAGAYTLTLYGGTWSIEATTPGYLSTRRTATVTDSQRLDGIDFLLTPGTSFITGTLRKSTGGEVLNHWIHANEQTTGRESNFNPGASGVYSVAVTAGTWVVNSWRTGYTLRETPRVAIGDGQTVGPIDLVFLPNEATVSGRVRDQSGNPMAGSRVRGVDATTGWRLMDDVFADVSGTYTLPIAAGTWAINVSGMGGYRTPPHQTITVTNGELRSGVDFTLADSNATVAGTVRDASSGLPLAGASVNTGDPMGGTRTTAGVSGAYTLTVKAGTYNLNATAPGYLRTTRTVSVVDGQRVDGFDFALTPGTSVITGTLRYSNGGTVSNWIRGMADGSGAWSESIADASGAYSLSVTAGTWVLRSRLTGYTARETPRVVISDSQTIGGIDLVFLPNDATVSGRVRDQSGAGVTGVQVMGEDAGTGAPVTQDSLTDPSGTYTLPIATGTWRINVRGVNGYRFPPDQTVTVTSGEMRAGVDFTLTSLNATIAGVVRDAATGLPLAGASINTGGPAGAVDVKTDAAGAYTLTVNAGTWKLNALKLGYLSGTRTATVGDGQRVDGIDFLLTPGTATITGTLRYSTGGAAANQWVEGWKQEASLFSRPTSDISGVYTMSVTAGLWVLHSRRTGYTLRETPRVTISDTQTIGGVDLVFVPNDATVAGRVVDQGGLPVAGAWVEGRDANTGYPVTRRSNVGPGGTYTLPMAAGTWRIHAEAGAGYRIPPDQTLTLGTGETRSGIDFTLRALNATIAGTMRDAATGLPLAGGTVYAAAPDWLTSVTTDAAGAYTLTVNAGTWRVGALRTGYVGLFREVSVSDGGRLSGIDFGLSPPTSAITGTLRYADGTSVAHLSVRVFEQATGRLSLPSTDAGGVFTASVRAGTWILSTWLAGYTLQQTPQVALRDSQTVGRIDLVLLPNTATVTGTVRDHAGLPVAGAAVTGADSGTGFPVTPSYFTDATGGYTLPIAVGTWRIGVQATGTDRSAPDQTVTVAAGDVRTGVDFTLRPPYRGNVQVSDVTDVAFILSWTSPFTSTGSAIAISAGGGAATGAADVRGAGAADETHYVQVHGLLPATTYWVSVYSGDPLNPTAVLSVTTGPTIGTIPPVDTIRGFLYQADGYTPAAGAIVYLRVEDGDGEGTPGASTLLSTLVGGDGSWLIDLPARRADLQEYFVYGDSDRLTLFGGKPSLGTMRRGLAAGGPRLLPGLSLVAPAAVEVQAGWTNVALPHGEVGPYTASSLLAELAAQGLEPVQLARWRDGRWESHIRGFAANDFPIEPGRGYFVRAASFGTWLVRPRETP